MPILDQIRHFAETTDCKIRGDCAAVEHSYFTLDTILNISRICFVLAVSFCVASIILWIIYFTKRKTLEAEKLLKVRKRALICSFITVLLFFLSIVVTFVDVKDDTPK